MKVLFPFPLCRIRWGFWSKCEMQMEWKAKHYGERFFWYNQKLNSRPQFPRNQIFYCKVGEENTQIFLQSKMVSVFTCIGEKGQTKAVLGNELNHWRKGNCSENWSSRNYRLLFLIISPCVAQLQNNLEKTIMWHYNFSPKQPSQCVTKCSKGEKWEVLLDFSQKGNLSPKSLQKWTPVVPVKGPWIL